MIRAEPGNTPCVECGATPEKTLAVTIGPVTAALCRECGDHAATTIQDKLSILNSLVPSHDEVTSTEVSSFATYPLWLLLDELVICTVNWHVGPLDADKRRIATALLERLAALGIARKAHRVGCEIWPQYRLCGCPWEVAA
jgi:hypothetical protein